MRRILWPLVLVLSAASSVALAQVSGSASPPIIVKGTPEQSSCPITFSARRYGLNAALRDTANGPVSEYTQSLQLRFDPRRASVIESMSVRVYGTATTAQVLPVENGKPHETMTSPMELTSRGGHFDAVQYITTRTIPLVTRIEITEIVYRDGTRSRVNACSVSPSLFVLVDAEATSR